MAARSDEPPDLTALLTTGVWLGCLSGGLLGALVGGLAWPPLGIGFGAVAGLYFGALFGVVNVMAIWAIGRSVTVRTAAGPAALIVSAATAALIFRGAGVFSLGPRSEWALVFVAAALGAGLGPVGLRLAGDPWWYRGPAGRQILRITARTAIATAAVGGIVGFGVGLHADVLTAPFAVVELALPAAALGLLLGAALGVFRVVAAGRRR